MTTVTPTQALAQSALSLFASHAIQLLNKHNGYLVEMTGSGLCLAAFSRPLDAIMWSVSLIEDLKHADWDEDLLAHEVWMDKPLMGFVLIVVTQLIVVQLCEEVVIHQEEAGSRFMSGAVGISLEDKDGSKNQEAHKGNFPDGHVPHRSSSILSLAATGSPKILFRGD